MGKINKKQGDFVLNKLLSLLAVLSTLLLLLTSCENNEKPNTLNTSPMFASEEYIGEGEDSQSRYRLDQKDSNLSFVNDTITITLHNNFLQEDKLLLYFTFIDTAKSDMLPVPNDLSFQINDQIILATGHLGADYNLKKSFGSFVFNIKSEQKEKLLSQGLDIKFNRITYHPLDIQANDYQAEGKWQYNLPVELSIN